MIMQSKTLLQMTMTMTTAINILSLVTDREPVGFDVGDLANTFLPFQAVLPTPSLRGILVCVRGLEVWT